MPKIDAEKKRAIPPRMPEMKIDNSPIPPTKRMGVGTFSPQPTNANKALAMRGYEDVSQTIDAS